MKRILFTSLFLGFLGAGTASATELCNVPEAEWQPKDALQQQLESTGWKVKKIKVDEGCYEVYGTDKAGQRMENYYDPKTFVLVKEQQD